MPANVAFVLLSSPQSPDPAAVVASARALGLTLAHAGDHDGVQQFDAGAGRVLFVMKIDAPHPDVATMAFGPTAIAEADAQAHTAHLIVTVMGLDGAPREVDTLLAALTAAVVNAAPAVGAMLGHQAICYKAKLFAGLAALGVEQGAIPPELAIDVTTERISESRMAFRTFNMPRYGRENFYITCPIRGKGALDFVLGLVRWMLNDPSKHLPTGETVGRTADEKVTIHRVQSPEGETHVRLDLS